MIQNADQLICFDVTGRLVLNELTLFMPLSLSIPPENMRKPKFSETLTYTCAYQWVRNVSFSENFGFLMLSGGRKRPMAWKGLILLTV